MHFMPLLVQNYRVKNFIQKNGNKNNTVITVITVILILTFDFEIGPCLNMSCNMPKKAVTKWLNEFEVVV